MKNNLIRRWFSLLMATVFLFGTVGLTINAHYCFTTNTLKQSIFLTDIRCEHKNDSCVIDQLVSDEEQKCCSIPTAQKKTDECCIDFTKYVRLVVDFDLPNIKPVFNGFLKFVVRVFELFVPRSEEIAMTIPSDAFSENTTKLTGLSFLISCSQLKLSDPLL